MVGLICRVGGGFVPVGDGGLPRLRPHKSMQIRQTADRPGDQSRNSSPFLRSGKGSVIGCSQSNRKMWMPNGLRLIISLPYPSYDAKVLDFPRHDHRFSIGCVVACVR